MCIPHETQGEMTKHHYQRMPHLWMNDSLHTLSRLFGTSFQFLSNSLKHGSQRHQIPSFLESRMRFWQVWRKCLIIIIVRIFHWHTSPASVGWHHSSPFNHTDQSYQIWILVIRMHSSKCGTRLAKCMQKHHGRSGEHSHFPRHTILDTDTHNHIEVQQVSVSPSST